MNNKNQLKDKLLEILDTEIKLYKNGISYISQETLSKIDSILTDMKLEGSFDEKSYVGFMGMYTKMYENTLKYGLTTHINVRKKAQSFISRKSVREYIFSRDKKCLCCGTSENLSIDHVIPISYGGENSINNLQTLCRRCNNVKGVQSTDYRTKQTNHE